MVTKRFCDKCGEVIEREVVDYFEVEVTVINRLDGLRQASYTSGDICKKCLKGNEVVKVLLKMGEKEVKSFWNLQKMFKKEAKP